MTNEPIILCNVILRAWFVRHRHNLERTKTFVFVLANEQAISTNVGFQLQNNYVNSCIRPGALGSRLFVSLNSLNERYYYAKYSEIKAKLSKKVYCIFFLHCNYSQVTKFA